MTKRVVSCCSDTVYACKEGAKGTNVRPRSGMMIAFLKFRSPSRWNSITFCCKREPKNGIGTKTDESEER